jgi:hypothetical protein
LERTIHDLRILRADPRLQRVLLQIALENQSLLRHALEHGRVMPSDLTTVHDLIRGEEAIVADTIHFLGAVTLTLFENCELPESCAHLRQTLTLTAPGSRVTHCAPSRTQ